MLITDIRFNIFKEAENAEKNVIYTLLYASDLK